MTSFSPALEDFKFAFIYSVGNFGLSVSSYKLFKTSVKFSTTPAFSKYLVKSSLGYIYNNHLKNLLYFYQPYQPYIIIQFIFIIYK